MNVVTNLLLIKHPQEFKVFSHDPTQDLECTGRDFYIPNLHKMHLWTANYMREIWQLCRLRFTMTFSTTCDFVALSIHTSGKPTSPWASFLFWWENVTVISWTVKNFVLYNKLVNFASDKLFLYKSPHK